MPVHGAEIRDTDGNAVGLVTSGGFGRRSMPRLCAGRPGGAGDRGRRRGPRQAVPTVVTRLPFVPHRYRR